MACRLEVMPLSAADLALCYPEPIDFPVVAYAGMMWPVGKSRRKPRLVAVGGLAWRFGRCDIWLHVFQPKLVPTLALVRQARRMLLLAKQMGEAEVYCIRDDEPNSAKLLKLVGMEFWKSETITFTDDRRSTGEIWRWQT